MQCESLKVDAAAVRALLAESSKYLNAKDEIAELRTRIETVEREKAEVQQKLSESTTEIGKRERERERERERGRKLKCNKNYLRVLQR